MSTHDGHTDTEHLDVPCPVCKSTAKRCKRPSGHEAMQWHLEREDALARLRAPTCERCRVWLESRGIAWRAFEKAAVAGGAA